jgi:murein DD-endopeptidase MepM/ murein hydrolase activator NlpD
MERKKIIIKPKENASSTPQTTPSKPTVTPQATSPKPAPKKTNWDIGMAFDRFLGLFSKVETTSATSSGNSGISRILVKIGFVLLGLGLLAVLTETILHSFFRNNKKDKDETEIVAPSPSTKVSEPTTSANFITFSADKYDIKSGVLEVNQTSFEYFLETCNLPLDNAISIGENVGFNLEVGKAYQLCTEKEAGTHLLAYKPDNYRQVVITLETGEIQKIELPSKIKLAQFATLIGEGLNVSLNARPYSLEILEQIQKILEYSIALQKLQPDDRIRIIYEEKRIADEVVGIGNILAVSIESKTNGNYQGFLAENGEYYSATGQTLKGFFLRSPVDYVRITSKFGPRWVKEVYETAKNHGGTDFAAPENTEIFSTANGIVDLVGYDDENGNRIRIDHQNGYFTSYLHLNA